MAELLVTGALLDGEVVGVRCRDGAIAEIGPGVGGGEGDSGGAVGSAGAVETIGAAGAVETIGAGGMLLAPALVNGHTHAAMTLFRGHGGDLPLMRWLREVVWPVEARLDAEDVYWGARLACAEMIRSGTARFWDMYWHPGATARAVADSGMRATIGGPLFDLDRDSEEMKARALAYLDELGEAEASGEGDTSGLGWTDDGGAPGMGGSSGEAVGVGGVPAVAAPALVDAAFAPHSIYTVSEGLLRWVAEQTAERGLPVQIHLSETEQEVRDCVAAHGARPAHYLDRLGLLGERTVLAHGVWLDLEELELIAARGAVVATNPVANMKLAVGGPFPYPAAREAGVAVGLGTDGAGSNDSLDLLAELKSFALIQRHASGDAAVLPAAEAVEIATGERAPLLRGDAGGALTPTPFTADVQTPTAMSAVPPPPLTVGAPADFLLLRADAPELALGELAADLVYAAGGAVVDTTVVAGRPLMRGGVVKGLDGLEGLDEIVTQATERARRLGLA